MVLLTAAALTNCTFFTRDWKQVTVQLLALALWALLVSLN